MKAEADRDVVAGRSPDVAGRLATMAATVRPVRENHQPFSGLWKFEQGQLPAAAVARSTPEAPESELAPVGEAAEEYA